MGVIIRTVSFSAAVTDSLNNVQRISLPSDFTVTPKLIRVVLTGATTDGTPTDDAQFSEGWYDGTSSWVTGLRANDVGVGINSDTDSYSRRRRPRSATSSHRTRRRRRTTASGMRGVRTAVSATLTWSGTAAALPRLPRSSARSPPTPATTSRPRLASSRSRARPVPSRR
jgi:hypothetical protein